MNSDDNTTTVPGFAIQYTVHTSQEFIDFIYSIAPNYSVVRTGDDSIMIVQSDKHLPYYNDAYKIHNGDYILPKYAVDKRVIFDIIREEEFHEKYASRA